MKVFREDFDTRWLSLVSPLPTPLPGVDNGPLALGPGRRVDVHGICVLNGHVAGLYSLQCRRWPAPRNSGGPSPVAELFVSILREVTGLPA